MTAIDAGSRTGRIEQYRVDRLARLPFHHVGDDDLGWEAGSGEVGGKSCEATFGNVERNDLPARRSELHRLAAWGCAKVERRAALARTEQAGGQRGGDVLNPPPTFAKARQAGDGGPAREPEMTGKQADALQVRRELPATGK